MLTGMCTTSISDRGYSMEQCYRHFLCKQTLDIALRGPQLGQRAIHPFKNHALQFVRFEP